MLELDGLTGGYGRAQVLFDVSLRVGEGELVCLMGRNGMGKTTTVKTLMGLLPAWGGAVRVDGTVVTGAGAARIARMGLGLVPEGRQVFPNLTVTENLVATAANRRAAEGPWTLDRVYALFPALRDRRASFGNLLSGGEQQMLAIGRALMTNPRLLILDEATEGLAPVVRDQIWACLERLRALGQAVLIIDKHVKRLMPLTTRFYVIERGRIVWSGRPDDLDAEQSQLTRYLAV